MPVVSICAIGDFSQFLQHYRIRTTFTEGIIRVPYMLILDKADGPYSCP